VESARRRDNLEHEMADCLKYLLILSNKLEIDLLKAFRNKQELDRFYDKVLQSYFKIFERCGLGSVTHLTLASGGSFSKYSHEFQTITDSGEDIIYLCDKCQLGINKEIISEQGKR
jgi:prolyl-tRNA synthetase